MITANASAAAAAAIAAAAGTPLRRGEALWSSSGRRWPTHFPHDLRTTDPTTLSFVQTQAVKAVTLMGTIVGGAAAAAASQAREGAQNSGGKQQQRLASAAKPVLRAQVSRGAAVAGPARKAGSRLKH